MRPLADEIRPLDLDEVVGAEAHTGPGRAAAPRNRERRDTEHGLLRPLGHGKTTVANIIARRTDRTLRRLNATSATLSDIKAVIGELDTLPHPRRGAALPRRDTVLQ